MISKAIRTPHGIVRTRIKTESGLYPEISARLKGQDVGKLSLRKPHNGKRTVAMVEVDASLRRRGVARAMYLAAEKKGLQPAHSDTLMPLGERFVRGMGTKRVGMFRVPKVSRSQERIYRRETQGFPQAQDAVARARFGSKPMDTDVLRDIDTRAEQRVNDVSDAIRANRRKGRSPLYVFGAKRRQRKGKALHAALDQWHGLMTETGNALERAKSGRGEFDRFYWRNTPPTVSMGMVPPTAVRRVAAHLGRNPYKYGAAAAASAATGVYVGASLQGTNLRSGARSEYRSQMDEYQRMLDERSKDKRYKRRGNNVYVKDRRFFRDSTAPLVEQLVRENKGRAPLYVDMGYSVPWSSSAATTYPHDKSRAAVMDFRAGLRNTGTNRLSNRFYATHEHQHVKDYAGQGKQKAMMEDALTYAYRKNPRQGAVKDLVTGRGLRRIGAFNTRIGLDIGYGEGRADAAAGRRLRVDPRGISGYPQMARYDSHFAQGYSRGGGKLLPQDEYDAMLVEAHAQRQFKQRAKQHKPRRR